jgi:hypothetical protein
MLWHKGLLETRWRLLFALAWEAIFLGVAYWRGVTTLASFSAVLIGGAWLGAFVPILLAGAGINTQPEFQAAKGLHGSTLFTLSLPVSRPRLLAVRASLGWFEMAVAIGAWSCAVWFLFPILRAATSGVEVFEYAGTLVVCASGLYSISPLLATFLDDLWRLYGSMFAFGALWLVFNKTAPAALNLFRGMGEGSPLLTQTMPWTAMGVSLAMAVSLYFVSLRVVQTREY